MDKQVRKGIKKRILPAIFLLIISVILCYYLKDDIGSGTTIRQRAVYLLVAVAPGVSALFFLLSGWIGLPIGYGFVALITLPRALPEPYNRYFIFLYFLLLLAFPVVKTIRSKKQAAAPGTAEPAAADGGPEESSDSSEIFVLLAVSGRACQLVYRAGAIRFYRAGGQFRGITARLDPTAPLPDLRQGDFSIPVEEISRLDFSADSTAQVRLRAGRRVLRFAPYSDTTYRALTHFLCRHAPQAEIRKAEKPSAPDRSPEMQKRLRTVYCLIGGIAIPIDLAWLFLDVPYELFACLALLPTPAYIAFLLLFPGVVSIGDETMHKSERLLTFAPLCFAMSVPAIRVLVDFNFPDLTRLLVFCGVSFAALMFLAVLLIPAKQRKNTAFLIGFMLLLYLPGAIGELNYLLDRTPPTLRYSTVESMHVSTSSKGPDIYVLSVKYPNGETADLSVSRQYYSTVAVGSHIEVTICRGAFDLTYAYAG